MNASESKDAPQLVRGLGAVDGALITIGSILGTGIFITTAEIARTLPHAGLILAVWIAGGLLTLAGALTYAELGAMFPKAGGQYHFLKEAYGPLWGFLFGWASFFVIMCGGIATLAVGFGEYLGSFLPFFSTTHVLFEANVLGHAFAVNGGQLGGALAIVLLTAVNYVGLREGAGLQNVVTWIKVGSIVGLGVLGVVLPAAAAPQLFAPVGQGGLYAALGVAMIAVIWSFDGWYAVTNMGGEMRRPERDLPLGLIAGTAVVTLLYVLMNVVYIRALPVDAMGALPRIGEAAAAVLFGPRGGQLITVAVLISTFGCISSTILYAARIYLPMAQDGVFLKSLAAIHPKYKTPAACILAQGVWSVLLTFSGSYVQLYTYVVFAVLLFHAATGVAVIVLRRTQPDTPRPYRTWGYPVVPLIFVVSCLALVVNTLRENFRESGFGLLILAAGLPFYFYWRRKTGTP